MLIINAKLHIGDGTVIENGWIRMENAVIHSLGAMPAPEAAGETLDAEGRDITPGLIDAHCHVGMMEDTIGGVGNDCNEAVDPHTPQMRGIDGLNPMDRCFEDALAAGVTSVMTGPGSANPVSGQLLVMKTHGVRADAMALRAPAAMKFATGENPKRVYGGQGKTPSTRMGVAASIRDALFQTQDYVARKASAAEKGEGQPGFNFKWEALAPVLARTLPAHFHAHRADDIFTVIRIAREFGLDFVIVHGTDSACIAEDLARENVRVITGPSLHARTKVELRSLDFSVSRKLFEAGLRPAICTDAPVIPLEYLPVCAGLAAKAGLPYEEALAAITGNAAAITGVDDRIGLLRPGLDADIVLWDSRPLSLEAVPSAVWVDGQQVR